jgi:hypothetical protein
MNSIMRQANIREEDALIQQLIEVIATPDPRALIARDSPDLVALSRAALRHPVVATVSTTRGLIYLDVHYVIKSAIGRSRHARALAAPARAIRLGLAEKLGLYDEWAEHHSSSRAERSTSQSYKCLSRFIN